MAPTNKNKRLRYDDSDTDSDKERSYNSGNNWPWFLVVETLSDDLPLSIPSPFAVQKGFQAVAGTLKSIKNWAMGLFWWNVVGNRKWWVFSRPLDLLIDQHRFPSTKQQLVTWRHLLSWAVRHDGDWNQNGTEETGCSWGTQGNVEEGYWRGPHHHPVSDLQHSRPPKRGHGQLSKGKDGLVCSQPDALLQLQVWTHEATS